MQAYVVNCNPNKVEKSICDGWAIKLYLDYERAKEKCEETNRELGGDFFSVVEVSVEIV